jgi:hypothetical protein
MIEPGLVDRGAPSGDALRRLDRTMAAAVGASRVFAVGQSAVVARSLRRQVRHPKLLAAGVVALVAHSTWATQRGWRRGSIRDPALAWSDGLAQCAALALEAASWGGFQPSTEPRWSETFGAVFTSWLAFEDGSPSVIAGSVLAWLATNAATVALRPSNAGPGAPGRRLNEASGHVAFTMVGGVLGREMVAQAGELDDARAIAVARAERLATERERERQRRSIHDSALQILEAIAGGWELDEDLLRRRIDYETARLQRVLAGSGSADQGLAEALGTLVDEFALSGLAVELDIGPAMSTLPSTVVEALADATHEALANVVKHAGVDRAAVRATSDGDGVVLVVIDAGRGFDRTAPRRGFGMSESIEARLRDVGGEARVDSSPGAGTRVRLRVPA